jgi:archaellum component FlaG (FlaF/FlaG flagellin family)
VLSQRFSKLIFLTIATMAVSAVVITFGILPRSQTVNNHGGVNAIGVGVYSEPECLNNVTQIDWGYLDPGATRDHTIYVKNEGNVPMTVTMTSWGWDPSSAEPYLACSWDREGSQVDPGSVLTAVLTLSVSPDITGVQSFSFNMTIAGSE